MKAKCPKCKTQADVIPAGLTQFSLGRPATMGATCKVLAKRLKENPHLADEDKDCPHLSEAATKVFVVWRTAAEGSGKTGKKTERLSDLQWREAAPVEGPSANAC